MRFTPKCGLRLLRSFCAVSVLVCGLGVAKAEALKSGLKSPWDSVEVTVTNMAYTCPAPPPFAKTMEIGNYYVDEHASVVDPKKLEAFQKASAASTELSKSVALAADEYLSKGSRSAGLCVFSLLDAAAKANAWDGKMPSFQGVYIQNWLLSAVAISYLKVRQSGLATHEQDIEIQRWFGVLSVRVREYFDEEIQRLGSDGENNHIYWAGLAVAAEGIANNDLRAFEWGLMTYRMGLRMIQTDGSLPAEMRRGKMALHYHLYSLGPLIMLAELGKANGLEPYDENQGAIHRLVRFCVAGLNDPTLLEKITGVKQVVTVPYAGSDIGWAVPYVRRFPNAEISALLAKAPWVRYTTWGGAPPN